MLPDEHWRQGVAPADGTAKASLSVHPSNPPIKPYPNLPTSQPRQEREKRRPRSPLRGPGPHRLHAGFPVSSAVDMERMGIRAPNGWRASDARTRPTRPRWWVLGLGFRPESSLAAEAEIGLGPTGAIAVDDHQRTDVDGVWAGGDCAEAAHLLTGRPVNYHLGTVANKAGRVAAERNGGRILGTQVVGGAGVGQTDRRLCGRHLQPDDGPRPWPGRTWPTPRPSRGVGPDPHRRPPGGRPHLNPRHRGKLFGLVVTWIT